MIKWMRDRRGSTDLLQFVLILPIFVLLFYGSFEVWKIVSVKQSLEAATYQAVRCLSIYHHGDEDRYRCERVLLMELVNNNLIDEDDLADLRIRYYDAWGREIEDPTAVPCDEIFSLEAELPLPWSTFIPGLPSRNPTLVARHRSYIECGPRWAPTPTPTPILTPTPTLTPTP